MQWNIENIEELGNMIIGRVEPHIYAFSTETVPNYLKVGDTYRPVEVRLKEWEKHYSTLKKQFEDTAVADKETFFRDYAVHQYLLKEARRERLMPNMVFNKYYSNEFFKNAEVQDIENAITDIKDSYEKNDGKYQFYKFVGSRIPITHTFKRKETYKPRPNQLDAINNFKAAIANGRTNLLMYAVMRFGKSFTSMCCAKEMNAKIVVIVSAKANVKKEWKKAVESHVLFEEYKFIDKLQEHTISNELKENNKIVIFATLQDLNNKSKIKNKHIELFQTNIDLLIVDETHFGARAKELGKSIQETRNDLEGDKGNGLLVFDDTYYLTDLEKTKNLRAKVRLHLSGTPYRILMGDEFGPEDRIAFCQYSDIIKGQEEWNKNNIDKYDEKENKFIDEKPEWENPYFGFPQMIRFAFHPNKSAQRKLEELKESGITYAFSALFRPKSIKKDEEHQGHKYFYHEHEILDLLEIIDGSKSEKGMLGFLDYDKIKEGQMCRHIVCVLPFRASCDAIEKLVTDNKHRFKNLNQYEIINIAGFEKEKLYDTPTKITNKITTCENNNQKTLSLTVNKMLTGSTVEEWDTMLYFKDTHSPQEYDQAIFRLQNPFICVSEEDKTFKYNMKPQTLLVDFNPNRMFEIQEEKAFIYNLATNKGDDFKLEEHLQHELEISPIVRINKNKLERVTPTNIIKAVSEYSKDKSVVDEATSIPMDSSLLENDEIRAEIEKQGKMGSNQGLKIAAIDGEGTDMDVPKGSKKVEEETISDSPISSKPSENDTTEDDFRKKFATYYSRILFFAFLSKDKITSLQELIEKMQTTKNNRRIATNIDLKINILKQVSELIDPSIKRILNHKINNISTLANENDVSPIDRVKVAMRKFGRLSSSEIVTPQKVADEMVTILPQEDITDKTKILDIASKQGEFVYAVYKKYDKAVANNFYSIPTSKVAYEFTRKVYELLDLDISHIETSYNSYDLIEKEKPMINENKIMINGQKMQFDILVGNPPYQENDGSGASDDAANPIYQLFMDTCKGLSHTHLLLIMPSKWMVGGKAVLKTFRSKMMEDKHISIFVDHEDSADCFAGQHIDGGICYFLRSSTYVGKTNYTYITKEGETFTSLRSLSDGDFDTVVRDIQRLSIMSKASMKTKSFSDIVSRRTPFGIHKDLFNSPERYPNSNLQEAPFDSSILIYGVKGIKGGAKRVIGYIDRSIVTKNVESINLYKVCFTTSFSTDAVNPPLPIKAGPGEICTETFLLVGPFQSEQEQVNCLKYMDSMFFKILLYFGRGTMQVTKTSFRFIPLQDFTLDSDIDWTQSVADIDQQLYKKYGLTKEEQQFIETMIKPM